MYHRTDIARLCDSLIVPNEHEREGDVPNVVCSGGSLLHGGQRIIPYGTSGDAATVAEVAPARRPHKKKGPLGGAGLGKGGNYNGFVISSSSLLSLRP